MTWFKVDDGLHKSRKRIRLGRSVEGYAALGLWTDLGSWCSDELTDGFISDDDLDYLAPGLGVELAKRLEAVGLFERVTRDGNDGWLFHDWDDYNPRGEEVLAERSAAADRQKRFRDKAKAAKGSAGRGQGNAVSNGSSNAVTHASVTPVVTVPPTRPDPTLKELTSFASLNDETAEAEASEDQTETVEQVVEKKPPAGRGTRIPQPFLIDEGMKTWATGRVPTVDISHETEKFFNYWVAQPGQRGVKVSWVATWHNWMLKASENGRLPTGHQPFRTDANRNYNDGEL